MIAVMLSAFMSVCMNISNERMEPKYRDKVTVEDGLLEELYAFYLEHEYVSVETWLDIEELLRCYVTREQ